MNRSTDVRAARVTANDDTAKLLTWHFSSGAKVRKGQPLYTLETSKAAFDVEAESDGYLEIIEAADTVVAVGQPIARLWEEALVPAMQSAPAVGAKTDDQLITDRARQLIAQHGLDVRAFAGRGMVREADVLAMVSAARAAVR